MWTVKLSIEESELPIAIKEIEKVTKNYNISYQDSMTIYVKFNDPINCLALVKTLNSALKRKVYNTFFEDIPMSQRRRE